MRAPRLSMIAGAAVVLVLAFIAAAPGSVPAGWMASRLPALDDGTDMALNAAACDGLEQALAAQLQPIGGLHAQSTYLLVRGADQEIAAKRLRVRTGALGFLRDARYLAAVRAGHAEMTMRGAIPFIMPAMEIDSRLHRVNECLAEAIRSSELAEGKITVEQAMAQRRKEVQDYAQQSGM